MLREIEYGESKVESSKEDQQKRSRIWAFLLSLIITGWGQIYNGQYKKGVLFACISFFPFLFSSFYVTPSNLREILRIFSGVVPYIAAIDAAYNAVNSIDDKLSKNKTIFVYLVLFVFIELIWWLPMPRNDFLFNPYKRWPNIRVYDASMEPIIKKYQKVKIDTYYYTMNKINRGDIVAFVDPTKEKVIVNNYIAGRVIAFTGEKVKILNKKIYVNDSYREESYYDRKSCPTVIDGAYGIVPADSVFVMGDACVSDTKTHIAWYVPLLSINGKVIKIYDF